MIDKIYVGVDGGATKSIISIADVEGNILGRCIGASANIRISVPKTWDAILTNVNKILKDCDLHLQDLSIHAVMGLAGVEIQDARAQFLATPHPFHTLQLTSDAHIACIGAHAGDDGSIIVVGTGVVGYQIAATKVAKVSGWGFPHDDIGGGAWLGLEAVKLTLQSLDGRETTSALTQAIYQHFDNNLTELVLWANLANSTNFAELAPLVIHAAANNDQAAINLLKKAAHAIEKVWLALGNTAIPCALVGGVAPFLQSYLSHELQNKLVTCKMSPDAGAILMARAKQGEYVRE